MQRKASKNTRAKNSAEKCFQAWLKEQPCIWCGNTGPSIVDHARGGSFKHNKVLIGEWFCLPVCVPCDTQKTIHGKRLGNEADQWLALIVRYSITTGRYPPDDVYYSISDFNK